MLHEDEFDSPDQRFILDEMRRYFSHDSTGVSGFDRMNAKWKDVVAAVQTGAELSRTSSDVENSVGSWHQEQRDLCLLMSRRLGQKIQVRLSKSHRDDPNRRFKDDCDELVKTRHLKSVLDIPGAAAPIEIEAKTT